MITSEIVYENYLKEIEKIFDSKPGTPEGNRLVYLVSEVEEYEQIVYPINEDDYFANLKLLEKIIDENPKEQSERWHYMKFIAKHITKYEATHKLKDDCEYRDVINRIKLQKYVMNCLKDTKAESCSVLDCDGQLVFGIEWNDGITCIRSCDFEKYEKK